MINVVNSVLLSLALGGPVIAVEVPSWILTGILHAETTSEYRDDGSIRYVDKRRGLHGERGAFQMTRAAFNQVKRPGEQFWMIEQDTKFAEEMAARYLVWLYKNSANGDWHLAIEKYNAGPSRRSPVYLRKVLRAARQ